MWYTIKETAIILDIRVRTIRKWISIGKIDAEKRGKYWYISKETIISSEVQENADKARKHSKRIKEGKPMGMLAGRS